QLQQDTHLVFTPQLSSLDSCALLSPSLFACGDSRGLVSLYSTLKKKPLASQLLHARQRSSYPLLFPPSSSSSSSCSDTHQPDKKEEEKTKEAMMKMIWRNGKKDLSSERKAGEKSHSSSSVLAGGGVSSLVALRQSDVFFTGSESGNISMWSITGRAQRTGGEEEEKNGLAKKKKNRFHNDEEDMNGGRKKPSSSSNFSESVGLYQTSQGFDFPHGGVVAGLAVSPSERFLIAAISKESRFGRWIVEKDVRNGIALIELEKED
ncbi:wd g-beta repeat-containing protein, partial [Cystoisospora suis]